MQIVSNALFPEAVIHRAPTRRLFHQNTLVSSDNKRFKP